VKVAVFALLAVACSSDDDTVCSPDSDGINGGDYTFVLDVSDTAFSPIILKAQNDANVTLTITNTGSVPHDFSIDCLPTPNDQGCPTTSCFDPDSTFAPIAPGVSTTQTFATPNPEGIYTFRSSDGVTGQFVVQ
jgi:hypothetical protein